MKNEKRLLSRIIDSAKNPTVLINNQNRELSNQKSLTQVISLIKDDLSIDQTTLDTHTFYLIKTQEDLKLKQKIKNLEIFATRKPNPGVKNYILIDMDYVLSTPGEYHRLLKLIEEPSNYCQIIIISKRPQSVPKTILSRVVRINWPGSSSTTNVQTDKISKIGKNSLSESLTELKNVSKEQIEGLFESLFSTQELKYLNYNQITYIQEQIKKVSKYHPLNLKPLEEAIYMLRKIATKKEKNYGA